MVKKYTVFLFLILPLLIALCGCTSLLETRIEELDGFSDSLNEAIDREYGITIPSTAEFVHGKMDFALRDPSVQIVFHIPENELAAMMDEGWKKEENVGGYVDDVVAKRFFWRQGDKRGCRLYVTAPVGGQVSVLLDGDNPSQNWLKD